MDFGHLSTLKDFSIELLKVLADKTRMDILELLRNGEITQDHIHNALGIVQSTISQHLKILINCKNIVPF